MSGVEIALLASTTLTAASSIMQGIQAKQAGEASALAAETQAGIAKQQGAADEQQRRSESRKLRAQQVAAIGESGLELSGSPLDLIDEESIAGEMDALTIRYQSELDAMGLGHQAASARHAGNQAFGRGLVGAGAAIAQGGFVAVDRGLFFSGNRGPAIAPPRPAQLTGPTGKLGGSV